MTIEKKLEWHTEKRKVKDLVNYPRNPRQLTEVQFTQLKKSLEKFNLVEIPAIDIDNVICAGHQRLNVMRMIGRGDDEIDVRVPNRKLTEREFEEYNIRSNKNTGEWDIDTLANFDEDLLNDIGFSSEEIDRIFQLDERPDEDEAPEPRRETTIVRGDIFMLGKHRIMCGDATDAGDVALLMENKKACMVFTDPPYNVNYSGGIKEGGQQKNRNVIQTIKCQKIISTNSFSQV